MKGVETKTALLVTDEERLAQLLDLLGERFTHHGKLLLPTFRQYEALQTDTGLESIVKEFCRWLGYKPRKVTVQFGQIKSGSYYVLHDETITVNQAFRSHPLTTGGILALATVDFISKHHHESLDDRSIEIGTIEVGLGLWIINAFQPNRSKREKFYHMIDGNWFQLEGLQLVATSEAEYLRAFTIFTSTNRLFPEDYSRGVSKRSLHLLPQTPSNTKIIALTEPTATREHIRQANSLWLKISLLSMSAALVTIFGIIIWDQRAKPINPDETRDATTLRIIKSSLSDCIKQASDQQSTSDPNDLFMTRQVDATKARCESLRNQYNEALSQYELHYVKP